MPPVPDFPSCQVQGFEQSTVWIVDATGIVEIRSLLQRGFIEVHNASAFVARAG